MPGYIIGYAGVGVAFLVLDLIWLGFIARGVYVRGYGDLLADPVNLPAAVGFYLVYVLGVMVFAVGPALSGGTLADAALRGAAFGFFAYATYDLTGLAVIRGFDAKTALIDIAWGTVLTGSASVAGFLAASRFA